MALHGSKLYKKFKKEGKKMKNLLKYSSLIRVAVIMVVMAFMASQVTLTYAKKIKLDEHDTDIKADIATHNGNMTMEHDALSMEHSGLDTKLDEILAACENGGTTIGVPKTGQTTSFATGDDGDLEKGVTWPNPRFTDNLDGTITDNLTNLIWDKNANRFGLRTWSQALSDCNNLADNDGDLDDDSGAGDWCLANIKQLQSLIHYGVTGPSVPDTTGSGQWTQGDPFNNVQSAHYHSSTTIPNLITHDYGMNFANGNMTLPGKEGGPLHFWCVRRGQ